LVNRTILTPTQEKTASPALPGIATIIKEFPQEFNKYALIDFCGDLK
jgi:hypothetical protein